jgi:hypothetical protein
MAVPDVSIADVNYTTTVDAGSGAPRLELWIGHGADEDRAKTAEVERLAMIANEEGIFRKECSYGLAPTTIKIRTLANANPKNRTYFFYKFAAGSIEKWVFICRVRKQKSVFGCT